MTSHDVTEALDAVWTGTCVRHPGQAPDECGAVADLRTYRGEHAAIETWYLE